MTIMQGGLMRINEEFGMMKLRDGDEVIASINFSRVDKIKAKEILKGIKHECDSSEPRIDKGGSCVDVVINGKTVLSFYWAEKDRWKYGIRTRDEAVELAEEFVRQYKEGLEHSNIEPIKMMYSFSGSVTLYDKDDEEIAIFETKDLADKFLNTMEFVDMSRFDEYGLESSAPMWDRSIRHESSIKEIKGIPVDEWILSLMQYMNDNWERCE